MRAVDFTDAEFDTLESIAGADFTLVQGISQEKRAYLQSRPEAELDTWNAFTRKTTRESLQEPE
ncbi:MAG: hypothetical protein AAFZ49_19470 [Cyanobacteria bacterium J06659_2]